MPATKAQVWRCRNSTSQGILTVGAGASLRMYASSAAETPGCRSGAWYNHIHPATQRNPTPPVARNAACQPHCDASHGTIKGQITGPMLLPLLNSPVARARSSFGYHSATARMAAGYIPPSARPSQPRAMLNPITVRAAACCIVARLQSPTDDNSPQRTPTRPISRPANTYPTAYINWNKVTIQP